MAETWHSLSAEEACDRLTSTGTGLSRAEAMERLRVSGPNELELIARPGPLRRFARQLNNVLLYVLMAAAAITALLGQWLDSGVIIGVVIINAVVGYLQEGRAEQALESIRALLSPRAIVLREGRPADIDARQVVPGDLVLLAAGDRVPADVRLSYAKNLEIDEAILTGESAPVRKHTGALPAATELTERSNMAFAGTLVTRGQARGYAAATGAHTELGAISGLLERLEKLQTPLLAKINRFGRALAVMTLLFAGLIGSFGVLIRELPLNEMLIAAISIAVAAIPEGLPPVITIALAIGVQLMARRNAIVRRLPAVETLGEVNVICTDKTGTLTTNEMTVRTVLLAGHDIDVTGVGYRPAGVLLEGDQVVDAGLEPLRELLLAGSQCNDSTLTLRGEGWHATGDPTEVALLCLAEKGGVDRAALRFQRLDVIPFESERRFMATLGRDHDGTRVIHAKGAPETILRMCRGEPDQWLARAEALADSGQRVLALARRVPQAQLRELSLADVDGQLDMLGLVGVSDPPRPEVDEALQSCRSAGIRVLMITGDHARTARAVSREIGMTDRPTVISGAELERMSPAEIASAVTEVDVFARVNPEHKLTIVEALQARGLVVAMTGDGVNDAPALKRADIGIAMGIKGTEAARRAAEIVLADDNFAAIVDAVRLGRGIYDNVRKSIVFLLPTSVAEALTIAMAILLGLALPITPVQILWINMITAVTLGIALAFEPVEGDVMQRTPRAAQAPLLSALAIWRTASVSLLMFGGVLALFTMEVAQGASAEYARTVAVNALVAFEAVYLLSSRRLDRTVLSREGLSGNRVLLLCLAVVLALQLLFTYTWPLQPLFAAMPLKPGSWLSIALAALALLALVELEKVLRVACQRAVRRVTMTAR